MCSHCLFSSHIGNSWDSLTREPFCPEAQSQPFWASKVLPEHRLYVFGLFLILFFFCLCFPIITWRQKAMAVAIGWWWRETSGPHTQELGRVNGRPKLMSHGDPGWSPFKQAMAPHSNTLAWKIPWTEEPGGLQTMGLLGVRHDWENSLSLFTFMHWRRKWQPTPVFLPGESQGQRSLVGCHLWGRTESDTTEAT